MKNRIAHEVPGSTVSTVANIALVVALGFVLNGCAELDEEHIYKSNNEMEKHDTMEASTNSDSIFAKQRLDPATIPKFVEPLIIPPEMPPVSESEGTPYYEITVKQFEQQILPTGYPKTPVWSYVKEDDPSTYNYPAFTVEARVNQKVRVKWINGLVDENGDYLPHLLPVDPTLHWANPEGPIDTKPTFTKTPDHYRGPVPLVTHVHGAHVNWHSDGYPESWYLPAARNIPDGFATKGTRYVTMEPTDPGAAVYVYSNDQNAATLWYHDHSLGLTRVNVYAGPAGFWLLRDDEEEKLNLPGPAPKLGDPAGTKYYEIPLAIQDRSFNADGSLFYPEGRNFFDEYEGPYEPETPTSPHWNPEVFGNAMLVNGRTWPYLEVEPRLYRFRFLNGSNSRFMILKFSRDNLSFNQIGSDGGLLPGNPLRQKELLMGPAERVDAIVDFSTFRPGDEIILLNQGPDEPYKGPNPEEKQVPANPATTGSIMKFKVVELTDNGNPGEIPSSLPKIDPLKTSLQPRDVTLNEHVYDVAGIPVAALLGSGDKGPLTWNDAVTENPMVGDTEIWRIINLTEDAHPVHLHLVMFQVLDRTPIDAEDYFEHQQEWLSGEEDEVPHVESHFTGASIRPQPNELGWKDTVIANPGEVTRVIAHFDLEGLYVWHCHILEHEDNEMMRPYYVGPIPEGMGLDGSRAHKHD